MFDFEQKLPWDMLFNGNIGTRYVITETNATGFMTLAHTAVTPAYNPVTNPGAVVTTTVAINTSTRKTIRRTGCRPTTSISGSCPTSWCSATTRAR